MPEGDTIYRTARSLREALVGQRVLGVDSRARQVRDVGAQRVVGATVTDVEPRGKHLLIWFAPTGLALHTHLGMDGAWHRYRPGQRWRKPAARAVVAIEVADRRAVCFDAPTCELLTAAQVARHPRLSELGPDALTDDDAGFDLAEARRRLDQRPGWAIGEALLDQRVLAGVGNVYKSEVLFVHGVHPWARVDALDPATRDAVLAGSAELLRANVAADAVRRTTTADPSTTGPVGDRLHVYGRFRRPCPRCGTPVRAARQGEQARRTYWCPRCQPPGRHDPGGHRGAGLGRPRSSPPRVIG